MIVPVIHSVIRPYMKTEWRPSPSPVGSRKNLLPPPPKKPPPGLMCSYTYEYDPQKTAGLLLSTRGSNFGVNQFITFKVKYFQVWFACWCFQLVRILKKSEKRRASCSNGHRNSLLPHHGGGAKKSTWKQNRTEVKATSRSEVENGAPTSPLPREPDMGMAAKFATSGTASLRIFVGRFSGILKS